MKEYNAKCHKTKIKKGKTFEIILSTGGSCCSVNTEHLS